MSLVQLTQQQLQTVAHFQGGSQQLSIACGTERLVCQLTALDALACAFEQLELHSDRLAGVKMDRLKALAAALSKRLTYLLEPISPIEYDAEAAHVQMRSSPPRKGDDGSTYYELTVRRGGALALCRYRKSPGQPREVIPAQVTREVLMHLINDFVAAVSA